MNVLSTNIHKILHVKTWEGEANASLVIYSMEKQQQKEM